MPEIFTTAVHAGQVPAKPGTPSATPIVTATSWSYDDLADQDAALGDPEAGYVYARSAAPTQETFEAAMTALELGAGAASFSSGMAALHAAVLTAAGPRLGCLVAATELYGATRTLAVRLAEQCGAELRWVNARDLEGVQAALKDAPAGTVLLVEAISNPLCHVADVAELASLARAAGARLVVDATFATPYLMQPLTLGAHFVAHSATKYIGGHGDVLAGVVVAAERDDAAALRRTRALLGSNLSPFDAYLALRGLRTLPLRVREQNRNAQGMAEWLARHPRVSQVYYPGLPASPDHAVAERVLRPGCFGGMLAFDLRGAGRVEVFAFMERLQTIQRQATLGDVATLAAYPAIASHRDLTYEQRAALGIGDGCVRVSAGIESLDDLLADLAQALTSFA